MTEVERGGCGFTAVVRAHTDDQGRAVLELQSDCAALRQTHRDGPAYDPTREQALVARTRELILALDELGLIDQSMSPGAVEGLREAAACPEPVPK